MRSRRVMLLIGLAAAGSLGCSSSADVLAIGTMDAGVDAAGILIREPSEKPPLCVPGHYAGRFDGTLGLEPNFTDISGLIDFDLEEHFGGEFITVQNSALEGKSVPDEAGSETIAISADVEGRGTACREGHFEAALRNGVYAGFLFSGEVEGTYIAESREFEGEWLTYAEGTDTEIGRGTWFARLEPEQD